MTAASRRLRRIPHSQIASCAEGQRVHRGNPARDFTVYPAPEKGVQGDLGARRGHTTGKCGPLHSIASNALPSTSAGAILDENARWHVQPQLITSALLNTKYFPEREDP